MGEVVMMVAVRVFADRCVVGVEVKEDRCKELREKNP
jgi:hypothetical protein